MESLALDNIKLDKILYLPKIISMNDELNAGKQKWKDELKT